jgi:hypothetical protein
MRYFVVSAALILALGVAAPAVAAVTSASISTGTPTYTGTCPTTINFTGTITYTAGTKFIYSFNRFINGVQQVVAGGTVTTGSGSYSVSDAIPVSSSASGNTFDQIWVHNISGGQSDVYSPKATFSVTCATPTPTPGLPTPTPIPIHIPIHLLDLVPAPIHVAKTSNPQVCGSHAGLLGSFACGAAFSNGWLVLVWDWSADKKYPNADGFNVYEVENGMHKNVDHVTLSGATVGIVNTPPGGFANQCYQVTAFSGNNESQGSYPAVCLGNGRVGTATAVLHSAQTMIRTGSYQYGGVPFQSDCTSAPACLGWDYDESSAGPVVIWHANYYYRAYYLFDLSPVANHYVVSATLKVPIDSGNPNCFSELAAADTDWSKNNGVIGGNFFAPNGSLNTGMDVTAIVRGWVSGGQPNFGFVLRSSNENLGINGTAKCLTNLDNAELDIVHS